MEKISQERIETYNGLIDRLLSKGYNGRDLISFLYERMPDYNEVVGSNIRHVSDGDLNDLLSIEEIEFLCKNFGEVFRLYYGDNPCNPLFDGETSDLVECIGKMMSIQPDAEILIPYHGVNFAIHHPYCNYQFLSNDYYAHIAAQHAIQKGHSISYISYQTKDHLLKDEIKDLQESGKTYDHIFAFPSTLLPHASDIQNDIINMLTLLKKDGSLALFLGDGVYAGPDWSGFREFLVQNMSYSTYIINVRNNFIYKGRCGSIFIIKKTSTSSLGLTLGDLTKRHFISIKSGELRVQRILEAFRSMDPAYFCLINRRETKGLFDLNPFSYPISDEARIKGLIYSFLDKDAYITRHDLIISLFTYGGFENDTRLLSARNYNVISLHNVMSSENVAFLCQHIDKVIEFCYGPDIHNKHEDESYFVYLEILSRLLEKSKKSRINLLLPDGDLGVSSRLKGFHSITSWVRKDDDIIYNRIIRNILKSNAKIISDIIIPNELSANDEDWFSHIILLGRDAPKHAKYGDIDGLHKELKAREEYASSKSEEIIQLLKYKLKKGGTMAFILPREACYKPQWINLREFLVNSYHYLQTTVVSFVTGDALFIVEKADLMDDWRGYKGIWLVDAIVKYGDPYKINIGSVVESIGSRKEGTTIFVPIVSLSQNLNFLAAPYLSDAFVHDRKNALCLRDIVTVIPKLNEHNVNIQTAIQKKIRKEDLSTEYLNCSIRVNDASPLIQKGAIYTVANGAYLTYANNKILIGKIDWIDNSVIGIDKSIIHFTVDSAITSLDYILKVLSSDEAITKQAEYLTKGYRLLDNTEFIDALLDIRIALPSLDEQNEELLKDSRKGYSAKTVELEKAFNDFKEDMHLKKHAIGQTIFSINNWMTLLKLARKRGEGVVKDSDVIGKNHPHSVLDIYENLEATMKRLQIQISKMDTGYEMVPVQIGVTRFINDFISKHPRSEFEYVNLIDWRAEKDLPAVNFDESNNFTSISATDFVLRKGDDIYEIYFPAEALELILENIISNACSHGFTETEKAYKIRISGEINGNHLTIYVSNNGAPIHKDFTANDVFKYAKSTSDAISGHHGTGGYEVWKLMKQFGGSAEFISTPEEEYTVTYKLTFQISNIIGTL